MCFASFMDFQFFAFNSFVRRYLSIGMKQPSFLPVSKAAYGLVSAVLDEAPRICRQTDPAGNLSLVRNISALFVPILECLREQDVKKDHKANLLLLSLASQVSHKIFAVLLQIPPNEMDDSGLRQRMSQFGEAFVRESARIVVCFFENASHISSTVFDSETLLRMTSKLTSFEELRWGLMQVYMIDHTYEDFSKRCSAFSGRPEQSTLPSLDEVRVHLLMDLFQVLSCLQQLKDACLEAIFSTWKFLFHRLDSVRHFLIPNFLQTFCRNAQLLHRHHSFMLGLKRVRLFMRLFCRLLTKAFSSCSFLLVVTVPLAWRFCNRVALRELQLSD